MAASSIVRLAAEALAAALGLEKRELKRRSRGRFGLYAHYSAFWAVDFTELGVTINRVVRGVDEEFAVEFADPEFEAKVRAIFNVGLGLPEGWLTLGNVLGNAGRAAEGSRVPR